MNKRGYIISLFCLLLSVLTNAQTTISETIEFDVEIEIDSANRNYSPARESTTIEKNPKKQTYSFSDYRIGLEKLKPRVPIYTIQPPKLPPLSYGFAKVGFGNYVSPFAEALITNRKNTKNYRYGVYAKHFSSKNGPVDEENSGISENTFQLFGDYFKKDLIFSGRGIYQRRGYRFYGYPDTLEGIEVDDIKRVYNQINLSGAAKKVNEKADFVFDTEIGFNHLSDNYDVSETGLNLSLQGEYRLDYHNRIILESNNYFGNIKDSLNNRGRTVIGLKPYYSYFKKESRVQLRGGFNLVVENDTLAGAGTTHFYPMLLVDVTLVKPPGFRVYAGIDGDIERNTWNELSMENPFIAPVFVLNHTNRTLSMFGGVKATILKRFTFDAGMQFNTYENLFFYVNDSSNVAQFDVIYDAGTTTHLNLYGEVIYTYGKKSKLGMRLETNSYNTSSIETAYHRPNFTANFMGTHQFTERISAGADIYIQSGIRGLRYENGVGEEVKLDAIIDFSLRGEYKLNQRFGAWTEANNLFGKEYQQFLQYPNKGANFLIGLNYIF